MKLDTIVQKITPPQLAFMYQLIYFVSQMKNDGNREYQRGCLKAAIQMRHYNVYQQIMFNKLRLEYINSKK